MNAAAVDLTETSPGQFAARGPLTFATAKLARERGLAVLSAATAKDIHVDCAGVSSSDSAGMTVLLDWLAFARRSGRALHYANLPAQIEALAHISDVLELLQKGV